MLSCFAAIEKEHRVFYRLYNNRTNEHPKPTILSRDPGPYLFSSPAPVGERQKGWYFHGPRLYLLPLHDCTRLWCLLPVTDILNSWKFRMAVG